MSGVAMNSWTLAKCVIAAAWMWLALAVLARSGGGLNGFVILGLLMLWLPIGSVWIMLTCVRPNEFRSRIVSSPRRLCCWLSVLGTPLLALGLIFMTWPVAVRIWLCESTLKAHAERVLTEPHPEIHRGDPSYRVGLFWVQHSYRSSLGNGSVAIGDIIYAPNGVAYEPGGLSHLYGPWYEFEGDDD